MPIKLTKQSLGENLALGIHGSAAEIEGELNALYNWNVWGRQRAVTMDTREHEEDTAHNMGHDGFVYVYTTEERLKKGMRERIINRIAGTEVAKQYKHKKGGIIPLVNAELAQTLANIETEYFMR